MTKRNLKILATVLVAVGGVAFIAQSAVKDAEYYMHVDKLLENPSEWEGKTIQVHGFAKDVKETVVDQKAHQTFRLEYNGKVINVRHAGIKPDTFKNQAETVVKGALLEVDGGYVIEAVEGESGIMAKCPSKYNQDQSPPKK